MRHSTSASKVARILIKNENMFFLFKFLIKIFIYKKKQGGKMKRIAKMYMICARLEEINNPINNLVMMYDERIYN